jgi:hypothetical protein
MASHTGGYIFFPAHCKHVECNTLTHSTHEDLHNIKRKGDPKSRTLSRTSDITETRNSCVIKVILYWYYFQILLNLFWHTDKNFFFCVEVNSNNTAPSIAVSLDPKKSRPWYISAQNISTLFWCTGWAWNWQIIFRFASIHGRACFILCELKRALYGIKCVLRIF